MGSIALQRVVVRMLFDPALVEAVYDGTGAALAEVELTPSERSWLRRPDRRAWGTDRFRRSRALKAVLEELPCALAAGIVDAAALAELDAFFSSPSFHGCIQNRGSLTRSFADWCLQSPPRGCFSTVLARGLLRLEQAIAALRRVAVVARAVDGSRLRLAPHVALLELPQGCLEAYQQLRTVLAGVDPLAALLAGEQPAAGLRLGCAADQQEQALLEARDGQVAVELCNPGLAGLLRLAGAGCAREQLAARARELGAAPGEDLEVLADFVAQGLLEPVD